MRLSLNVPITIGKKTITELEFRDYTTADDYLAFDVRGGVAQRQALIASMSGTDVALIRKIRGVDYIRAERIVSDMLAADDVAANSPDDDRIQLLANLTGFSAAQVAQVLGLNNSETASDTGEDGAEKKSSES